MVLALLVYDWLLCLDNEVRFIWNWRSRGVTISLIVYALSRYTWLIQNSISIATIYPMSDLVRHYLTVNTIVPSDVLFVVYLDVRGHCPQITCRLLHPFPPNSCRAGVWAGTTMATLGFIASSSACELLLISYLC